MRKWGRMAGLVMLAVMLLAAAGAAPRPDSGQATTEKAYVGNSSAKKYHKPSCRWAGKISAKNRVEFPSAEEAEKAGYKACKVCLKKPKSRRGSGE